MYSHQCRPPTMTIMSPALRAYTSATAHGTGAANALRKPIARKTPSFGRVTTAPARDAPKSTWRHWLRDKKAHVDADTAAAIVAGLRSFVESFDVDSNDDTDVNASPAVTGLILFYRAMPHELSLDGLAEVLGWQRFAVTRTPPDGPLTLHPAIGAMEQHRFGFPQPTADAMELQPRHISLALVPGVAFDRLGTRLGHGAGYFDELLSRLPSTCPRVGVTPLALVFDRLPAEAHDVPMTHFATASGVVEVGTGWLAGS